MTDETMAATPDEQPTPNMITEEQLRGRLAQQQRHHDKAMADMEARMNEMQNRLGQQAAQNVIDSGSIANQGMQQPHVPPVQQPMPQYQQPQIDVNQIKQDIMNSMQQAQQEQQQKAVQDRMNQQRQEVVNNLNAAQQEDPELQEMIQHHQATLPATLIEDLYGESKPAGVLKQLLANDELRQQYQNATTPLDRNAAIRRAALAFNTQMTGHQMSRRPGARVPTTRS